MTQDRSLCWTTDTKFVSSCTHTHTHTQTPPTHTQIVGVKNLSFLLRFGVSPVVYIIETKEFQLGSQNEKLDSHNEKLGAENEKLGAENENFATRFP